jgi:GTP-binding protein Era
MFGHKLHLFLHVKVRENWPENRAHYRERGLDFDA